MDISETSKGGAALFAMRKAMEQPRLVLNLLEGAAASANLRTVAQPTTSTPPAAIPASDSGLGQLLDLLV